MTNRRQCINRQVLGLLLVLQASIRFGHVVHVAEAVETAHPADPPPPASVPTSVSGPDYTGPSAGADECDPEMVGFELVTGYVYTAPTNMLESIPGTLMLTDCLETCQANDSCQAVNYETGLCVLFSSNADSNPGALSQSQFPVFTIYAQKSCLAVKPCERAWCIDRVQGHRLQGHARRTMSASSRQHCLELCLGERDFLCRGYQIAVVVVVVVVLSYKETRSCTGSWSSTNIDGNCNSNSRMQTIGSDSVPTNQPTNQPTNRPTDRPTDQPTYRLISDGPQTRTRNAKRSARVSIS
ncbi:hypothetical protein M0804_002268 [Polistes exclamans]|nr:hypothetical protein M0804_002268 [Polistes exclamans]